MTQSTAPKQEGQSIDGDATPARTAPKASAPTAAQKPTPAPSKAAEPMRTARPEGIRTETVRRRRRGTAEENKFFVPPELIPDGMSVEWKRISTFGKLEDPSYHVGLNENGWEPAPFEQFAQLMPKSWKGNTIERDGMMLMMRPMELTMEARAEEREIAEAQVGDKMRQLGATPEGELPRQTLALKRSYEVPA